MKIFRTVLHGHIIEFRRNDIGGETVIIDGAPIQQPWYARLYSHPHYVQLDDERGQTRQIELRIKDISRMGLGRHRLVVSVDGIERCRLEPIDDTVGADVCRYCGYSLIGLEVNNNEVQCPECGRHSPAAPV